MPTMCFAKMSMRLGVCLAALPLLAYGCAPETEAAKPEAPKVTVAYPQERELTDYDEYNGWTEAPAMVEVRSRVRGHIMKVGFTDGQFVEEKQELFELDPQPFQSEIDRAKERVKIAQAQQEAALREETRQKELKAQNAARQTDVDKAEAARKVFDAEILSAEEEVRRAELELSYSKVTAPIAGKVGRAMLTAGNLVNAGGSDPLLTTIVAVHPIYVYFAVDERALLEYRARHGAVTQPMHDHPLKEAKVPFEFRLETDTEYRTGGTLNFAENRIDPDTGTIQVRGEYPNEDGAYLPGSRVRVRVPMSDKYPALVVPDEAVLSDLDKKYLLVLDVENEVTRRDVQLGKLLPDGARVILPGKKEGDGITAKDRIIVEGLQRARLHYPVQPMNAKGEPFTS
jgi:RND family efflux transporter MFP subunit